MPLLNQLIRLAYKKTKLRPSLLPIIRAQEEETEEKTQKKGPPPMWQEFLDAKYKGGKQRIKNTNPETRESYPEVQMTTRMRQDKEYQREVLEEYRNWMLENQDKKIKEKPAKAPQEKPAEAPPEKPAETPKQPKLQTKFNPKTKDFVGSLRSAFSARFKETGAKMKTLADTELERLKSKAKDSDRDHFAYEAFNSMNETERMFHTGGHLIGEAFESSVLSSEMRSTHDKYMNGWKDGADTWQSNELYGAMSELGIKGGAAPWDKKIISREDGAENEDLQSYCQLQWAFTQAFFEDAGIKEITVFRGVKGQGFDKEPPKEGDETQFEMRELSSWTSDPGIAYDFGRPVEYKVPIDRVFSSALTYPPIGGPKAPGSFGESEVVIMGASELKGTVRLRPEMPGMGELAAL